MAKKYAAEFSNAKAHLSRVNVVRETEKSVMIANDYQNLMGHNYFTIRTAKRNINLFDTGQQAVAWLIGQSKQYEANLLEKLEAVRHETARLEGILAEYESEAQDEND